MIIFGLRSRKTPVKNGLTVDRYCPKCLATQPMQEHKWRKFFTLYFIPIIPVERGDRVLVCGRCDSAYVMQDV